MRRRADQGAVARVPTAVLCGWLLLTSWAAPAALAADDPAANRRALERECDALVASAAKTPYGWGWNSSGRPAGVVKGRAARAVTINLRTTAAAGLVLHLAGKRLGEPKFEEAAKQAGRAVAAVQMKTGQIPAEGVIRANAGGRDEPLEVPSRSATCACLGLLVSLTHDADANNPSDGSRTRRAAAQAAHWLSTQQTASGGWLVTEPPDARPGEGTRLVRLDDPGYRDAFIALHLAAHVLEDERLARQAAATEEDLDALRIGDAHSVGYRLWSTAYTPDHEMVTTPPALSPAADTVASRNAMHALLAACLLGDADTAAPILQEAAASVAKLPKENGAWRRRYPLRDNAAPPPAEGATDPAPEPADAAAATGVEEVLRAAGRLDELKPQRFREAMGATLSVHDRLALTLCGLGDAFLTEESPPPGPAGAADDFELTLRRTALLAWRVKEN